VSHKAWRTDTTSTLVACVEGAKDASHIYSALPLLVTARRVTWRRCVVDSAPCGMREGQPGPLRRLPVRGYVT
jgi:hypothetical protein